MPLSPESHQVAPAIEPDSLGSPRSGSRPWWRNTGGLSLVLAILLYLGVYARSVGFALVWDDFGSLVNNKRMRGPLRDVLTKGEHARLSADYENLPKDLVPRHESYRPVSMLSHWIDLRLFGVNAGIMHLHSLLLGLLSIVLVYALSRRLGLTPWLPALWALHPLHVEVFAYVSARSDLLAGIFSLAALCAALAASRHVGRIQVIGWSAIAFLLQLTSLFAKESNLTLPFAFVFLLYVAGRPRRVLVPTLGLVLTILAYFPMRKLLMEHTALQMTQSQSVVRACVDTPGVVLAHLTSMVWPIDLSPDRLLPVAYTVVGWGILLPLAVLFPWLWRRSSDEARGSLYLVLSGLAGAGCLSLPAALGVRSIGALADRYAFLSLLFLGIAVIGMARWVLGSLTGRTRIFAEGAFVSWGAIAVFITSMQVGMWRNDSALADAALASDPENSAALYRASVEATARGDSAEAVQLLEHSLRSDPNNQRALNNLAVIYLNVGRLSDAKSTLRRLLLVASETDWKAWYNLAEIQLAEGHQEKACSAANRALSINRGYALALRFREKNCQPTRPAESAVPGTPKPMHQARDGEI